MLGHKTITAAKKVELRPQRHLSDSQTYGFLGSFSGESIGLNCRAFVHGRRLGSESTRILRTKKCQQLLRRLQTELRYLKTRLQVVRYHLLFVAENAGVSLRPLQERRAR